MSTSMRLVIPEDVLEIARTLEEAGHEAWCVGGALRDALLGHPHSDYDFATSATPAEVTALFRRTAPVGEKYGTVGVLDRQRVLHEVTTFRHDVSTDGRHAVVAYGVSLDEDLARRDFTVNAIAYHPLRHEWRDPFGGRADLERGLLRAVGRAEDRFREDYLRILRGIRFAARFGFTIVPETWDAAIEAAPGLAQLSAERVRDEWLKGLRTARSVTDLVTRWIHVGAAARLIPELESVTDAWLAAAERVPADERDPIFLTALLLGDAPAMLRRLRASNAEIERAAAIARGPAEPAGADARAARRWLAEVGPAADDLLRVYRLRRSADAPWSEEVARIRERRDPLERRDLAVTGADLQGLGATGPRIGVVLAALLEQVLDDPSLNRRETLLALARELP
ncbi:MAG: CCA tRNA nucleotidyltransferase [Gemmatimonadales bacterium]